MCRNGARRGSLLALVALLLWSAAGHGQRHPRPQAKLVDFYNGWLDRMSSVLTDRERTVFVGLENDGARERFIHALWQHRGEQQLERWVGNERAVAALRSVAIARERIVRLAGKPADIHVFDACQESLRKIEAWTYRPWQIRRQTGREVHQALVVLFVQEAAFDNRSYQLWTPRDGGQRLTFDAAQPTVEEVLEHPSRSDCLSPAQRRKLEASIRLAASYDELVEIYRYPPREADWPTRFLDSDRGPDRYSYGATRFEIADIGTFANRTLLRGRIRLPPEALRSNDRGDIVDEVTILGDVYSGSRLVDTFRIRQHVVGASPRDGSPVLLEIFRKVAPGTHTLDVRVQDHAERALFRERRQITVPHSTDEPPPPGTSRRGYSQLTRAELVVLRLLPSVELLPLGDEIATEDVVARAHVVGREIRRVRFLRDGEEVATRSRPPFDATIRLARNRHTILVEALNAEGEVLSRDQRSVERVTPGLAVQLSGDVDDRGERRLQLRHGPDVEIESVECFAGSRSVRRLTGSALSAALFCPDVNPLAISGPAAFLRVLVTTSLGETAEDVLFVGTTSAAEVDVPRVELYATITDSGGRLVTRLDPADATIVDPGGPRPILRWSSVANLPVSLALLLDVSSSMGRTVRSVASSTESFFADLLRQEDDRASLLAFNQDLHRLTPFTSDLRSLQLAARGLRSWGSTRLYDGLIYALQTFGGLTDRRALVVLSDGADVDSDLGYEEALDLAERTGVSVYTIALGRLDDTTRRQLAGLSRATGGRHYSGGVSSLSHVFRQIEEELRSQHQILFEPSSPTIDLADVELRLHDPSLVARVVHAYREERESQ